MAARDKILSAIKENQPAGVALPEEAVNAIVYEDAALQFIKVLEGIGGQVVLVNGLKDIDDFLQNNFAGQSKNITSISGLRQVKQLDASVDPHSLADIQLAILLVSFAVAENGAAWLTEEMMQIRALPFICQQLAIVLNKKDILHNMQQAYDKIGTADYAFGVFIAGPSKTADIEQSLVLGAHGPKSMIAFIIE
jgi:L-lactate dehydrogenase complex protein LldG